jgi:hypothetical protein
MIMSTMRTLTAESYTPKWMRDRLLCLLDEYKREHGHDFFPRFIVRDEDDRARRMLGR